MSGGDAIYSEFVTEIAYQMLTSTRITTEDEVNTGEEEPFKEMSPLNCVFFLIDLIGECQSSVFQWDRIHLGL